MVTAAQPAPKPRIGIYRAAQLPAEVYHRLDAANFSALKLMDRSPAHAYHAFTNPDDPTEAMTFGDATHAALLEPDRLVREYFPAPTQTKKTKAEQTAWREAQANNPGKLPLRPAEWARLAAMREAVLAHPEARALLEHAAAIGTVEVSGVWRDPETGVLCKMRADGISRLEGRGCLYDLKTCPDAREGYWSRVVIPKYAYHAQAAHYRDGLQVLAPTDELRPFFWVAVEKDPPHGVMLHELDPFDAEHGAAQVRAWLTRWRECEETGSWPCYPPTRGKPKLPDWATRDFNEENDDAW